MQPTASSLLSRERTASLLSPTHQMQFATIQKRLARHAPAATHQPADEEKTRPTVVLSPSHYRAELQAARAAANNVAASALPHPVQTSSFSLPPLLGTTSPLAKRAPKGALVARSQAAAASPSHSQQQQYDSFASPPSRSSSSVRKSTRFADDPAEWETTNDFGSRVGSRASSPPELQSQHEYAPICIEDALTEDPFASFAPAVSSRAASMEVAPMLAAASAAPPSVHVSYMQWQLPSSFAPSLSLTPPAKKLMRHTRQAAAAAATLGTSEYVLGVLDEVDPPLATLAIYLDSWLERYIDEPLVFDSPSVFISVKYQELRHLLSKLQRPNSFRTWLASDLLLKLIALLPQADGGSNPARALGERLFHELLLNIYTKTPAKNFGMIPYQLIARQALQLVHDRTLQRAEALSRVQAFHLHRRKILERWQPCIVRAIHAWTVPLLAMCFLRWKQWRRARLRRGTTSTLLSGGVSDRRTFLARFLRHRRRKLVQSTCSVLLLNWKLFVNTRCLNTSLEQLADLRATVDATNLLLSAAMTTQAGHEEKLRQLVKLLWETQHDVLELKCRIREENETHKVHSGQKTSTLILTQWYRYLYLHLTSNHQRGWDGVFSCNFQDTNALTNTMQSQRMRNLFEGFKKQGNEGEFVSIKQFLQRGAVVDPVTPDLSTALVSPGGANVPPTPGKRSSMKTSASLKSPFAFPDLESAVPAPAKDVISTSLSGNRRGTLQPPSSKRRSGIPLGMFDSLRAGGNLEVPIGSIVEENTPMMAAMEAPLSQVPPAVSLDDLSNDLISPAMMTNASATPPNAQSPPTPSRTLRSQASTPTHDSDVDLTPIRRGRRLNARRTTNGVPSPLNDRAMYSSANWGNDAPGTTVTTPVSRTSSRTGSRRSSGQSLPPHVAANVRTTTIGGAFARRRWRMAIMAIIYSLKPVPEAEEVRVIAATRGRDKEAMLLNTWMKHQVHVWKASMVAAAMAGNMLYTGGLSSHALSQAPISQELAEKFVRFLVNHTTAGSVSHSPPLDWSSHLEFALSPEQKALPALHKGRVVPAVLPPNPQANLPPIAATLTSNLNLVDRCPVAHPYLALSPNELHFVKIGMAQVLGVGFVGAGPEGSAFVGAAPGAADAEGGTTRSAETEYGLFHAVWLRLFSVLPSLSCDNLEEEGLDFDSLFLQLAEADGLSRSMLHSAHGYLTRSGQLDSFLSLNRSLRFALKKKRVAMTRSNAIFVRQKRTLQAVISTKLNQLIRDGERDARNAAKAAAASTTSLSSAIPNEDEAETAPTTETSANDISIAMISRRASISMSLGTGLLVPGHPGMVNGVSSALMSPPALLSAIGSAGMSTIASSMASTVPSAPGSGRGQRVTHSASLRVELGQASVDIAAVRAAMQGDGGTPSNGGASSPVNVDSANVDSSSPTLAGTPRSGTATPNRSPIRSGRGISSRDGSPSPGPSSRRKLDQQLSIFTEADELMITVDGDDVEEDEAPKEVDPALASVDEDEPNAPLDNNEDVALSVVLAASRAAGTPKVAEPGGTVSIIHEPRLETSSNELIGEGQMEGLDSLALSAAAAESEAERINRRHIAAPAYEVDIIHSTLVALVNEEVELRAAAKQAVAKSNEPNRQQVDWGVLRHAVEVRRCEILLATHLSQLRKWYRTCLSEEVKSNRGKVKTKLSVPGTDMLVVTRDKVAKLFQRAKLMSSGARGFTNAIIAQAWAEIVAWKSEKEEPDENVAAALLNAPGLSFDAAVALLCKLSTIRFRSRAFRLPNVSERLNAFLQLCFPLQVLPYTSMASKFYPLQAALANANNQTAVGSAQNKLVRRGSLSSAPLVASDLSPVAGAPNVPPTPHALPPPPMAYLGAQSSFEGDENEEGLVRRLCDDVMRANQKWLAYLFQYYAKEKEVGGAGAAAGVMEPAMSRDNFMDLITDSTLLAKKVLYLRTINSIWIAQQTSQAATLAAEALVNPNAKPNAQIGDSLMTYRYFLDSLRVVCVFFVRDPMVPLPAKLDRLVAFLWSCSGFERCRISMGVSNAVQNSAAQAQLTKAEQLDSQQQQEQQPGAVARQMRGARSSLKARLSSGGADFDESFGPDARDADD